MNNFIEVHDSKGAKWIMNTNHIVFLTKDTNNHAIIYTDVSSDDWIRANETYEEVKQMLETVDQVYTKEKKPKNPASCKNCLLYNSNHGTCEYPMFFNGCCPKETEVSI